MEGVLPSGRPLTGIALGDVTLAGPQAACVACHRRSGLGSTEGQEAVPPVTGDLLYVPRRLPTSKPPLAPQLRPAYTKEALKLAISAGIGADGRPLRPLMPRFVLNGDEQESLIAYLEQLPSNPAPGVDGESMQLATVVSDGVEPRQQKGFLDVLGRFVEQRNRETRHEGARSANAPWHEAWTMKPYRKWTLHTWRLEGPQTRWPEQLQALYDRQPVFAVVSGLVAGHWEPIHRFCESRRIPCIFPVTDLPVDSQQDFYSVYFSRGMALEADTVLRHLADSGLSDSPLVQVYRAGDPRAETAARRLAQGLGARGRHAVDRAISDPAELSEDFWGSVRDRSNGGTAILWLDDADAAGIWPALTPEGPGPRRVYLSTTLRGTAPGAVPEDLRPRVYFVHPYALPEEQRRLAARSLGWLRANRIADSDAILVQADALFALKATGEAVKGIRGFFNREYFLERIEHQVDNATDTALYPSLSLAPGQRFVSRGAHIAQLRTDGGEGLASSSGWLIPGSR